jgi:putative membrane protein
MINLIQAYSVSMKHFLRGEQGIYYADLYPLISFLPQYVDHPPENGHTEEKAGLGSSQLPLFYQSVPPKPFKPVKRMKTFNPEQVLPQVNSDYPLRPARNPPRSSIWVFFPFLLPFRWLAKRVSRKLREAIQESGDERTISGKVRQPAKVESNVPLEVTYVRIPYHASKNLLSHSN